MVWHTVARLGNCMASPALFVSYRRNDSKWFVGRFGERLKNALEPAHRVFLDVDSIRAGSDFADVIGTALSASRVVLVVVGPGWLSATDSNGHRRLDDPQDWVRREIETALALGKLVIPVLVDDTPLPTPHEVPESIRPLLRKQLLRVSYDRFTRDVDGLIGQVEAALREPQESGLRPRRPAAMRWVAGGTALLGGLSLSVLGLGCFAGVVLYWLNTQPVGRPLGAGEVPLEDPANAQPGASSVAIEATPESAPVEMEPPAPAPRRLVRSLAAEPEPADPAPDLQAADDIDPRADPVDEAPAEEESTKAPQGYMALPEDLSE